MAYQEDSSDINETDITDQAEVLSTGPVHEAFAETATSDTEPGIVVTKMPPDPIEEIPPDQSDLEEGAEWIPGYWAWDDERNDFIWISGTWRVPPPGRHWVPGRWVEVEQGYQWISGYWAGSSAAENEYLPEPPESMEEGPNVEAPSSDYAWIQGCWIWAHGYYAWRPGYWARMRPNWIWVPAYYVWTPWGYIYAGGYWDYVIVRRGILFAPVYFRPRLYHRVVYTFTPGFVVRLNLFSDYLFFRPTYRHYYFGNYYASKYHKRGIYPVSSKRARKHGYDPIYAHQQYKHRSDSKRGKDARVSYQDQRVYEDQQPKKTVYNEKNNHRKRRSVSKNTENALPLRNKQKGYSSPEPIDKGKSGQKKNYQTRNRKMPREGEEVFSKNKSDRSLNRNAKKSKMETEPGFQGDIETDKRMNRATDKGSNRGRYTNPEPVPEEEPVVETPNEPRISRGDRKDVYTYQQPKETRQDQQGYSRGPVNKGAPPVTRDRKAFGQGRFGRGRFSDNGGRNSEYRPWTYNGRRR